MRTPNRSAEIIAAELNPRERVTLFCIASRTRQLCRRAREALR
jgi:hypothetical protein